MSPSLSPTKEDDYFNDLTQQTYADSSGNRRASAERTPSNDGNNDGTGQEGDRAPKLKRIACVLCRKRKLRCDGQRPNCGTCGRLGHECAYDEIRRKSGPKRGYVKALEARLAQVETLLKTQETSETDATVPAAGGGIGYAPASTALANPAVTSENAIGATGEGENVAPLLQPPGSISPEESFASRQAGFQVDPNPLQEPFSWEMIGLGLDEPLPAQDVINDLHQIYFEKVHPSVPMIHRPRYFAAMGLAPNIRPPICLRYIMWCVAASITDRYDGLHDIFYQRARKYIQADEMKGHGEQAISVAHTQTWVLIAMYEFKMMYFPRAWMSTGRAVRTAQMIGLHRLDGEGLDVKQCLAPPKDWTEREERRRTFWMTFCEDRYASIGTGWPMTIEENDIMTNLPATDEAFDKSRPMATTSLDEALSPSGAATVSPFAGVVLMACLFGRNLTHLHRPTPQDRDDDLNGEFWRRHREMESILLNTALALPDHLRLPAGIMNPNVVFLNMCIHTSAICLHQAAIFKAERNRLPMSIGSESKIRCITAAAEIASNMRAISHMDLSAMNPFLSFCLYVAARVFVQYLRSRPQDQQVHASLQFLLAAMQALKRKNPLTESFLAQLDVDLESGGFDIKKLDFHTKPRVVPINTDTVSCSPVVEIRDSQSAKSKMNTFTRTAVSAHTCAGRSQSSSSTSPGPPFHLATQVTMDLENRSYGYMPRRESTIELPNRSRSPQQMDTSPDPSAGDRPTPSTTNSHRGSSSHTSYASPEDTHNPSQYAQSRAASVSAADKPHASAAPASHAAPSFYPTTDDEFANLTAFYQAQSPAQGAPPSANEFVLPPGWDLPGTTGAETGMTPLADTSWQTFEGLGGWDGTGNDTAFDVLGRRVG